MENSVLVKKQTQKHVKHFVEDGRKKTIVLNIRYDDQCGNGHNSFSMTGVILTGVYKTEEGVRDSAWESCGCIHEEIEKRFSKLKHLIKWHLCSSDGLMHYVSNTLYHSRDTDYNGLKKGEYSAYQLHTISDEISKNEVVTLYKTGEIYTNNQNNKNLKKSNEKETKLLNAFNRALKVNYVIKKVNSSYSLSAGKNQDFEAARSCAIWPDATNEQLQDKEALERRIPELMERFKSAVESLGFVY